MDTTIPTYHQVTAELGIVPEHTYARCIALAAFNYGTTTPARRTAATTPKVGAKPVTHKRKTAKR